MLQQLSSNEVLPYVQPEPLAELLCHSLCCYCHLAWDQLCPGASSSSCFAVHGAKEVVGDGSWAIRWLWEQFLGADLKERWPVVAGEGTGVYVLLGRAQQSPLGCCCQGFVVTCAVTQSWGNAGASVVWERILGFVDVPGEAQALPGSGRLLPAPPAQAGEDLRAWCCSTMPVPCFMPWVQAGGLLLSAGTGQNVCQGGPDLIEMTHCWGYFWQGICGFLFVCLFFLYKIWFSHWYGKKK